MAHTKSTAEPITETAETAEPETETAETAEPETAERITEPTDGPVTITAGAGRTIAGYFKVAVPKRSDPDTGVRMVRLVGVGKRYTNENGGKSRKPTVGAVGADPAGSVNLSAEESAGLLAAFSFGAGSGEWVRFLAAVGRGITTRRGCVLTLPETTEPVAARGRTAGPEIDPDEPDTAATLSALLAAG
jgi:hypothetical protein